MDIKVRDSNGAQLAEGDTVTLKLKGSSTVLKRGTVIRNIHLTDDADEIEGRTDKVKGLVLRTEFLKKACAAKITHRDCMSITIASPSNATGPLEP
jgi:protein PhnA